MSETPPNIRGLPLHERALMALKVAVEKAIRQHAKDGVPIYVWRDGKVVEIPAEQLRARLQP